MRLPKSLQNVTRAIKGIIASFPKGEQGDNGVWGFVASSQPAIQDDVTLKKGFTEYARMKHDPDVKSALSIKCVDVLSKGWEINPCDSFDDKAVETEATKQSDFVKACFKDMQGSLDDFIEDNLYDALLWGQGISEKNWKLSEEGFVVPSRFKCKDSSLYSFDQDNYGNVTKMWLQAKTGKVEVDMAKFTRLLYNAEHDSVYGTSDLRSAYLYWLFKDKVVRWWAIYTEKFASPTPKGTYPVGTPGSKQTEILNVLKSMMQETAIVVPEGTEVEFLENMRGSSDFLSFLEYLGKQIVKAILGQTLATEQGTTSGSYAQSKVHQDTLKAYIRKLKRMIEQWMNEQVIRDMIDYNFADRYYPEFQLMLDDKDITALADVITKLTASSVVIPRETWIRPYLGIPPEEEGVRDEQDINVPTGPVPKRANSQKPNPDDDTNNDPNAKPNNEE